MLEAAGLDACAGIEKGLVSERHLTLARGFSLTPPPQEWPLYALQLATGGGGG